jgi:hypothetical protein
MTLRDNFFPERTDLNQCSIEERIIHYQTVPNLSRSVPNCNENRQRLDFYQYIIQIEGDYPKIK